VLGGLFTPFHLLFFFWGKVVLDGLSFILHSMAAGEHGEELRASKRPGTIHLPGHWPVCLLLSNTSIIMFSVVPPSLASYII